MNDDYGDNLIKCPLLNKKIDESYCFEINIVRRHEAKKTLLEDTISREDMDKYCLKCKYRPF